MWCIQALHGYRLEESETCAGNTLDISEFRQCSESFSSLKARRNEC